MTGTSSGASGLGTAKWLHLAAMPTFAIMALRRRCYAEFKGVLSMKLYLFPTGRVLAIQAMSNYLALDCDIQAIDLGSGDQRTPQYMSLNPNKKMPALEDDGFVLWESNAILFYMAAKHPGSGLWPSTLKDQADVLRWLAWESAHWDAESCGMVSYEKASKAVLGLGPPDPAFIARGEQNFVRFAGVLDTSLRGKTWLVGERLTIADFSVGGLVPTAERMALPVRKFPEIVRWYNGLAALPAWQKAAATNAAAMAAWQSRRMSGS
ncbi:MAG TPA: glutathione S-transferase family protein [Acetobacteraceae bacterium]|jgi:glutathione S-transferase|nr:glutathione S-transferase family protein [Acetobacteraceae bacterium]